ncbi:hypothetical protein JYJ95_07090 [Corallococcus exiguus]|uniref:hypothetical protein n=1 Tax=Corallococcus exiguus TaxID=83462 RepID=UPI001A8F3669|nr:hypothetical protein [Corallococcus exiguus]MBN8466271.1 hypothetical protein [Corallococcus exiguus]
MSHPLPLDQARLVALRPAPSTLPPDAAPPWPPPALSVKPQPLYDPHQARDVLKFALISAGIGVFFFLVGVPILGGSIVLTGLGLALYAGHLRLPVNVREWRQLQAVQDQHLSRARLAWARVENAAIVGSVQQKGVVRAHVMELDVVPWHAAGPTARLSLRVTVAIGTAGHVVPGAYLGVLSDPEEPWALPQCVLTLDGAQLPL